MEPQAPIWEQVPLPTCQRAVQYDRDEHVAEIDDQEAT